MTGIESKALNYLVHAQSCDLDSALTKQMNKYPKGSLERALFKSIRFGLAYGKLNATMAINGEYSIEDLETRLAAMYQKEQKQ